MAKPVKDMELSGDRDGRMRINKETTAMEAEGSRDVGRGEAGTKGDAGGRGKAHVGRTPYPVRMRARKVKGMREKINQAERRKGTRGAEGRGEAKWLKVKGNGYMENDIATSTKTQGRPWQSARRGSEGVKK